MPSDTLGRPCEAGHEPDRPDGARVPVPAQDDVAEFAALLRELKGRTDRSDGHWPAAST
ncbi:hypothetical protein STENM223S_01613 [Streptomyces tendae]